MAKLIGQMVIDTENANNNLAHSNSYGWHSVFTIPYNQKFYDPAVAEKLRK
jgi:hypothetical protein